MTFFLQLLITIFSAIIGSLFTFIAERYNSNKKLLINQLNLVYMPLYREICFTPLNSDQKHLLTSIHEIIYKNFQYVPDDLFELAIKLLTASKSNNFDLWHTTEWTLFIKKVEIQYINLQKLVNFDRKANDPEKKAWKLINSLTRLIPSFIMGFGLLLALLFILYHTVVNRLATEDQKAEMQELLLVYFLMLVFLMLMAAILHYLVSKIRDKYSDEW